LYSGLDVQQELSSANFEDDEFYQAKIVRYITSFSNNKIKKNRNLEKEI
jgi:hypothetical protein